MPQCSHPPKPKPPCYSPRRTFNTRTVATYPEKARSAIIGNESNAVASIGNKGVIIFRGKPVVAVIPARGFSRSLPGKNLAKVGGQTLIQHAVNAAFDSGVIDIVLVSSDDAKILEHANSLGTVVAHRRAEKASHDDATAGDVIRGLFQTGRDDVLISEDNSPWFVYLQPTSPLRTGQHLLEAFQELVSYPDIDGIASVSAGNPSEANGAIYIFSLEEFRKTGELPTPEVLKYVMSDEASLQVKSAGDLAKAEALLG